MKNPGYKMLDEHLVLLLVLGFLMLCLLITVRYLWSEQILITECDSIDTLIESNEAQRSQVGKMIEHSLNPHYLRAGKTVMDRISKENASLKEFFTLIGCQTS